MKRLFTTLLLVVLALPAAAQEFFAKTSGQFLAGEAVLMEGVPSTGHVVLAGFSYGNLCIRIFDKAGQELYAENLRNKFKNPPEMMLVSKSGNSLYIYLVSKPDSKKPEQLVAQLDLTSKTLSWQELELFGKERSLIAGAVSGDYACLLSYNNDTYAHEFVFMDGFSSKVVTLSDETNIPEEVAKRDKSWGEVALFSERYGAIDVVAKSVGIVIGYLNILKKSSWRIYVTDEGSLFFYTLGDKQAVTYDIKAGAFKTEDLIVESERTQEIVSEIKRGDYYTALAFTPKFLIQLVASMESLHILITDRKTGELVDDRSFTKDDEESEWVFLLEGRNEKRSLRTMLGKSSLMYTLQTEPTLSDEPVVELVITRYFQRTTAGPNGIPQTTTVSESVSGFLNKETGKMEFEKPTYTAFEKVALLREKPQDYIEEFGLGEHLLEDDLSDSGAQLVMVCVNKDAMYLAAYNRLSSSYTLVAFRAQE